MPSPDLTTSWPLIERRHSKDPVFEALEEIKERLTAIEKRLDSIEHRLDAMSAAFVVNDLGKPDYDGHRKAHLDMLKTAAQMDAYMSEGAKKVIGAVVLALAGIFVLGLGAWLRGGNP